MICFTFKSSIMEKYWVLRKMRITYEKVEHGLHEMRESGRRFGDSTDIKPARQTLEHPAAQLSVRLVVTQTRQLLSEQVIGTGNHNR